MTSTTTQRTATRADISSVFRTDTSVPTAPSTLSSSRRAEAAAMLPLRDPTVTRTDPGAGDTGRRTPSDAGAWKQLVAEYQDHLLKVASSYRIGQEAHDVVQRAWLRLIERSSDIRDWNAVGAWLTAVVRRECLRVIRSRQRERLYEPEDFEQLSSTVDDDPTAEDLVVAEESRQLVRRAMKSLPQRQHDLLQALSDPDAPGYAVISERLGMPVGSMGPTRQRALRRLQAALTDEGLEFGQPTPSRECSALRLGARGHRCATHAGVLDATPARPATRAAGSPQERTPSLR